MYKKGEKFFQGSLTPDKRIVTIESEEALVNFGIENDLYDPHIPQITTDDFEKLFRDYGEDFYNQLVIDIENLPTNGGIPKEIKDRIATFMAAMRVRTPQFKKEVEDIGAAITKHELKLLIGNMSDDEIKDFSRETLHRDVDDEFVSRMRKSAEGAEGYRTEVEYPNGFFLQMLISSIDMHVNIFQQMTMDIYKSTTAEFITSDNPITFFVPQEKLNAYNSPKSLTDPHAEVFFPVSKNIGVHLTWRRQPEEVLMDKPELVDTFNYNISHHSFNFIFSPSVKPELEKFTKEYIPYPFRFVVR